MKFEDVLSWLDAARREPLKALGVLLAALALVFLFSLVSNLGKLNFNGSNDPDQSNTGSNLAETPQDPVDEVICTQQRSPLCGVSLYALKRSEYCAVSRYRLGQGPICGIESFVAKASSACPVVRYNQKASADCGLSDRDLSNQVHFPFSLNRERFASLIRRHGRDKAGQIIGKEECAKKGMGWLEGFSTWSSKNLTCHKYLQCRHEAHGVEEYEVCKHPDHGNVYASCRDVSFGVEEYEECRHEEHGVQENKMCSVLADESALCTTPGTRVQP